VGLILATVLWMSFLTEGLGLSNTLTWPSGPSRRG
jgi:hypothetical protein